VDLVVNALKMPGEITGPRTLQLDLWPSHCGLPGAWCSPWHGRTPKRSARLWKRVALLLSRSRLRPKSLLGCSSGFSV